MSEQIALIVFCIIAAVTVCNGRLEEYTKENQHAKPCGIGQFYYNKNITRNGQTVYQRCKLCPRGSYNDRNTNVVDCTACPWNDKDSFVHTRFEGATSVEHCFSCLGWCDLSKRECYTRQNKCDGRKNCPSGQDEMNCENQIETSEDSKADDEKMQPTTSGFHKYSWFFFIPVPFVICAGFGKLYHTQKNRGLPVNAETGSPIRIHYRPHVSGRSRSRSRRSSQPVTIEMPLIPNSSATIIPNGHTPVVRSPSSQSQRTRSSQGSLSTPGQHLAVEERGSRRSSSTSQRSRSGSHSSRSFSRSPRLGGENERQRNTSRVVQPAAVVLPNQLPPRHIPLGTSVSLPPFPFPSPMNTTSHPPATPPLPVITSSNGSPPPPSYHEVITSTDAYPPSSPPHTDELPTYEAAIRNPLSSTSSA